MTRLSDIHLENFRCHERLRLHAPGADWIVLAGGNGSGKTSILEALYIAARGRSFRSSSLVDTIRHGSSSALAFLKACNARNHALGVEIQKRRRLSRLDGAAADLTTIAQAIPLEYLGGDAVRLLQASPADRRRFMDWTLFHVEPGFLPVWRQWYRAHRQRNALLKSGAPAKALAPWTEAAAEYGDQVTRFRAQLIVSLEAEFASVVSGHIKSPKLIFRQGWRGDNLWEAFRESATREIQQGRAVVGPQHDDWGLEMAARTGAELSRGQAKLASLFLYRCQAALMLDAGRRPVYLMDDIAADLDRSALSAALELWKDTGVQIWATMLMEDLAQPLPGEAVRFHVEHGGVSRC